MIKRLKGNVTMPPRPRAGMDALTFASGVWRALHDIRNLVYETPIGGGGGGSSPSVCAFGEIIDIDTGGFTKAIRGGLAHVGDKNFDIPHYGFSTATPFVHLIELKIGCEANMDDDSEIILPRIKTSSETDTSSFWNFIGWSAGPPSTQYTDNTNPTVTTAGIGEIVIPVGKLTVDADGFIQFEPTACGNITADQCAGTLSYIRG